MLSFSHILTSLVMNAIKMAETGACLYVRVLQQWGYFVANQASDILVCASLCGANEVPHYLSDEFPSQL